VGRQAPELEHPGDADEADRDEGDVEIAYRDRRRIRMGKARDVQSDGVRPAASC
jgi:hypothetical protein